MSASNAEPDRLHKYLTHWIITYDTSSILLEDAIIGGIPSMIRESLSKRGWELERVIPRPRTTRRTDISYLHSRDAWGLSLFEDFRFDNHSGFT